MPLITAEKEPNPVASQPIVLYPGLVALAALLLYGLTLNHWVTFGSLPVVAKLTGWDWHPLPLPWRANAVTPLWLVLTFPFRWLPANWQPVGLNLFSAFCAALTLAVLARSVRLLPHDRTREQRQREPGEFALLSMRQAFLPAALAVLVLALQLTFWENAISATGEILDVLVFAFLVQCLLEFRISQNERWLSALALTYGLGMTNNWALIGFFPCFLIALVWIKGLAFFNWRFLARMAGLGALGLLLYCLVPLIGAARGDGGFWLLLRQELSQQVFYLRSVPRWVTLLASIPTLVPLFFMAIRWPSFGGELSVGGGALTRLMIRILHLVFLAVTLMMFSDFRLGPSPRAHDMPGFLSFYYLAALCVGYFTGYLLLVFGKDPLSIWQRPKPLLKVINRTVIGVVWLVAVAAPCWLLATNLPRVRADNGQALAQYAEQTAKALPAKPSILLCDDRIRAMLFRAINQRLGRTDQNAVIETGSFRYREYLRYLVNHYPQIRQVMNNPNRLPPALSDIQMIEFLLGYSQHQPLFYLHPSFGYFFEAFYLKPEGLVYELKRMPTNTLSAPLPADQDITFNEGFWNRFKNGPMVGLPAQAALGADARVVAAYYSQALDLWGTELQKAGTGLKKPNLIKQAAERFSDALQLNTNNIVAQINLQYNARLRGAAVPAINSAELLEKAYNQYRGWEPLLNLFGPVDDPDTNLQFGRRMAEGNNLRQAGALFERCLQLRPGDPDAELGLAKTFVDIDRPDRALQLIGQLRAHSNLDPDEVIRVEAIAYYKKNQYEQAEKVLQEAHQQDPKDENRLGILIEFYRTTAYVALEQGKPDVAAKRFRNALNYVTQQLQLLNSPTHSSAGLADIPNALIRKAEMETMLSAHKEAIITLTQFLQQQPDNPVGLLNRATSELQITNLPAAKSDYLKLQKVLPDPSYDALQGLGKIADLEGNAAEAAHYYKRCLTLAPTNSATYQDVKQRLHRLQAR
jgi:tetratricopeptide (TPR) repeat protein